MIVMFIILGVCKVYSEQKAVRVKRVVDRKRMWVFYYLLLVFAYRQCIFHALLDSSFTDFPLIKLPLETNFFLK